jgi:hypothetical protein
MGLKIALGRLENRPICNYFDLDDEVVPERARPFLKFHINKIHKKHPFLEALLPNEHLFNSLTQSDH